VALTDSLVAYWKLDEASGNALALPSSTFDLTDTNTCGTGTGKINGARDFIPGNSEHFTHADHADLSAGNRDWWFGCWFKADSFSGFPVIVSKGWGGSPGGTREWIIYFDTGTAHFAADDGLAVITQPDIASSLGALSTGTWYRIDVWHDATANVLRMAINNGTVNEQAWTNGINDSTAAFVIGASPSQSLYWDGLIDEAGWWLRIPSAQDLTDLYNGGAGLSYDAFAGNNGAVSIAAPVVAGAGTVFNPPTVVAAGTAAYTATNGATIAPGLPSGWAANDIHVLIAARGDNTAMTTLSGWNSLSAANNTAAFRVEVWWRRAVGGDTAPTITFGTSTIVRGAQIIGIRGCPTNVDPFAVALSRSDNAASATVTFATITPNQAKTLLLALYAYEDDPSAASQITNWSVFTVSTSALGNDMSLGYASRIWETANSATGALTSTASGGTFANSPNTGVILSLAPIALTITGTGAPSISPPVLAGTGTFTAPSSNGAISIGVPVVAGTGSFATTGSGAPSILKPVIAGTGSFATTGTGAVSIGIPVIAGTGSFATTGSGAVAIGAPVLAAAGSFATTGTGAISIGIPVLAGTGTVTGPPGSGDIGIAPPVLAGAGTFTTTGSGTIGMAPPAVAAAGSFATTGSGSISIGGPAVAGSGSAVDPGTGSGAVSIAAPVLAASGAFTTTGSGALAIAAPVVAGTGTFTPLGISGTGAITVGGPQIQGTGSFATTGTGAVTVGKPAAAGTGTFQTLTFTGTGTITIPAPVLAGTGTLIYTGTGTITIAGPVLLGYSVLATRAAASDAADTLAVASDGLYSGASALDAIYATAAAADAASTGADSGDLALVGAAGSDEEV
jgi:Concanavalin A-like lectin/glucanases superfamily